MVGPSNAGDDTLGGGDAIKGPMSVVDSRTAGRQRKSLRRTRRRSATRSCPFSR